ncbi:MAG: molybdopterin-dependent oxidoreductase [Cytophagales bacterium]|nr:molybdopterin-dependent oxidoreductase [Cytophagales bacterium]
MTLRTSHRFAWRLLLLLGGACLAGSPAFAQSPNPAPAPATATIQVSGEVTTPLSLTVEALGKLKKSELTAKDRDGKEHRYTGVAFVDLLRAAGVTLGPALRGENLAKYVLVEAADGYQAVFALPELDPEFAREVALVAYQADGKPLPAGEGPFRLVVPADKKHARWVREVAAIKVLFAE